MKKGITVVVCICALILVIGLLPVHGEAEIYEDVLRLHVIANSDSEEDQALKLAVRDRIIQMSAELGEGAASIADAEQIISANIDSIRECAQREVYANGYDYPVDVRLVREEYPTKSYTSLCFPSGEYLSLQVLIGEAAGQNWWCVLFPPLCLDAASSTNEDAFISVGLTPDQYKIITNTNEPVYEARFKLLEVIEGAINN